MKHAIDVRNFDDMNNDDLNIDVTLFVIFGIPGAGKTTIAKEVAKELTIPAVIHSSNETTEVVAHTTYPSHFVHLDLDDCVPDWMRTNFANGIYPTLQQRYEFSMSCCAYIDESIRKLAVSAKQRNIEQLDEKSFVVLISFSFVNEDLRTNVRQYYSSKHIPMHWILIDTNEVEAQRRIEQRSNHFYKGIVQQLQSHDVSVQDDSYDASKTIPVVTNTTPNIKNASEWTFAPVSFPHTVVNGHCPIATTSSKIVTLITNVLR